jgi:ATP-dependent Lon protease
VPAEVLAKLAVHPVGDVRDVLALALEPAASAPAEPVAA